MIPLAIPNLTGRESEYLQECIETTFVSSVGPFVTRFEKMVAEAAGSSIATATSAGTTGLHAALVAVGVGQNDLVVLPSFTFIASANAIAYCGASPWLLDVTAESWTLNPTLLAEQLATETTQRNDSLFHKTTGRRVAAIMPVYTLGMPADMDAITKIANDYNLPVVADGAAALGASYKNNSSGTFGADLTVYSFNGNKIVTAGGGGTVVGEDPELMELVRHLTTTAKVGQTYHHDRIGFNYRMTNIAAAIGCAQMERLEEFIGVKREIQKLYNEALENLPEVNIFPQPDWAEGTCWLSGVIMANIESAEILRCKLKENSIDARSFWKPIHLQPMFTNSPTTAQHVSSKIWSRIVTLPCSTGLKESEQAKVIETIQNSLLE
jgi:aminotransferase in exopolysaccharide biosynthesis